MKKHAHSNWQPIALSLIASVVLILAASSSVCAQGFGAGAKVEIKSYDYFDDWYKAEILEAKSDGRYKVRYEGGVVDTVDAKKIRLLGKTPTAADANKIGTAEINKSASVESKNMAVKFKPGDRVECDKAQIGRWEKGTVLHYRPNDLDKESGRYYRVKLDNFKMYYPEGHEIYAGFIRPINEPAIKSSGKFQVGDRIEAHDNSGAWLSAKIVAVQGAFYKVSFDNYSDSHDQFVDEERIRRSLGTAANEAPNKHGETSKQITNPATPTNLAMPANPTGGANKLPGTSWKVSFYNKGAAAPTAPKGVPMLMLFCPDGRWDNVRYGLTPGAAGAVGMRGTYNVAGSQVSTSADTGKKQTYKMNWVDGGKILDLDSGSGLIMRLFYNGETTCR